MNNRERLTGIVNYGNEREAPKVTITLPTHRRDPENQQDKILFKNLLQEARESLSANYPRRLWEPVIEQMLLLLNESLFWMHTYDGLVVLGCDDRVETFMLRYPVSEAWYAGDCFNIFPLFTLHQIIDESYLVDLSKDRIELYCVNVDSVEKVRESDLKTSFSELFDDFDADANLNVGTYSGLKGTHHGHRTKPEELEKDREKYFRYLDKAFEKIHKSSGRRFILAGTAENLSVFKKLSQGRYYYDRTLDKPLPSIAKTDLPEKLQEILQPVMDRTLEALGTELKKAEHAGKLLTELSEIQAACTEGRIRKLILKDHTETTQKESLQLISDAFSVGAALVVLKDQLPLEHPLMAICI